MTTAVHNNSLLQIMALNRTLFVGFYCAFAVANLASYAVAQTQNDKSVSGKEVRAQKADDDILKKASKLAEDKEFQEAYTLVSPLAGKGNPAAMYLLSQLYQAINNWDEQFNWLKKAAEKKHPSALNAYGKILIDKERSKIYKIQSEPDRGVKILLEAEKLGNPEAMVSLGWVYWQGIAVPVSSKEALRWYDKYEKVTGKISRDRLDFIQADTDSRVGRKVCLADPDYPPNMKPIVKVTFSDGQKAELQISGTIVARSDSFQDVALLINSINATTANGGKSRLDSFFNTSQNIKYAVGTETWVSSYAILDCY